MYGVVRSGAGYPDEGRALAREALEIARRLGYDELLAHALMNAITVAGLFEQPAEVVELFGELEVVHGTHPVTGAFGASPILVGGTMATFALHNLGRGEEGGALGRRLSEIARGSSDPAELVMIGWIESLDRLRKGDVAAALDVSNRVVETAEGIDNAMLRAVAHWQRSLALGRADWLSEATQHAEHAIAITFDGRVNRPVAVYWLGTLAGIRLAAGDAKGALDAAERGVEIGHALPAPAGAATNELWRSRALVALGAEGTEEELHAVAERVEALAEEIGNVALSALACEARGDWAEAARLHRRCGDEWAARRAESSL